MLDSDDKPREIAKRFRATLDPNDPDGVALLTRNDEMQLELSKRINSPFIGNSPRDLFRSKALVTIESLLNPVLELTDEMTERLAESFAQTGRYDLAAETSIVGKALYEAYWEAVWAKVDEWCEHPSQHKTMIEWIYSIRVGKEVELYRCNICRKMNTSE